MEEGGERKQPRVGSAGAQVQGEKVHGQTAIQKGTGERNPESRCRVIQLRSGPDSKRSHCRKDFKQGSNMSRYAGLTGDLAVCKGQSWFSGSKVLIGKRDEYEEKAKH